MSATNNFTEDTVGVTSYYPKVAEAAAHKAAAYANLDKCVVGPSAAATSSKAVISSAMFPPKSIVSYASVPMGVYAPASLTPRDVKHVVLCSFAQSWHANMQGGGWLNSTQPGQGSIVTQYKNQDAFFATGSLLDGDTFYSTARYLTAMQRYAGNTATQPAHFIINRKGDLVVVEDCNTQFLNCGDLSETCVTILLEEALYTRNNPREYKNRATWGRGNTGNVEYADYSTAQLQTLAVLVRKLELAYPALVARNLFTVPGNIFQPGYVVGQAVVRGTLNGVSPHFAQQSEWNALFTAVDGLTNVTEEHLFKGSEAYYTGVEMPTSGEINATSETGFSNKIMEQVQIDMMAYQRAYQLLMMDKSAYNSAAADGSQRRAVQLKNKSRVTQQKINQVEAAPVYGVPAEEQPEGVNVAVV